jgi:hypothetical protein
LFYFFLPFGRVSGVALPQTKNFSYMAGLWQSKSSQDPSDFEREEQGEGEEYGFVILLRFRLFEGCVAL